MQLKNHIEVFIGFASICLLFSGRMAPIFPIFYWQYLRIKYVVNYFTKNSFRLLDVSILQRVFPGFMYRLVIERIKNKMLGFVSQGESQSQEGVEEQEKNNEDKKKN